MFFNFRKIKPTTDIPRNNTSAGPSRDQLSRAMDGESDISVARDSDFLTDTVQTERRVFQESDWGPVTGNFATFELPVNLGIPQDMKNEMTGKNESSFFQMFASEDVINMIVIE